jgi:hypothetical protein
MVCNISKQLDVAIIPVYGICCNYLLFGAFGMRMFVLLKHLTYFNSRGISVSSIVKFSCSLVFLKEKKNLLRD